MAQCKHAYEKLNENAVFCRGCGDIKSETPACTLPHYPVWYPYWTYTPWWPNGTVTSGSTGTINVGTTVTYDANDGMTTYTVA